MKKMNNSIKIDMSLGDYNFTESAEEAAANSNCYVVIPKGNELLIDIDSEESYTEFKNRFLNLKSIKDMDSNLIFKIIKSTPSKSGLPNRHITVGVYNLKGKEYVLNEWERICLQFVLGSDHVREVLSTFRLLCGVKIPTRFFEPLEN